MDIQRIPFCFDSQGACLFAWLHRSILGSQCQRGVVICPPIGYEQIHSHRSLRHLADALALARYSVLRFDYHGTGDSPGLDEEPDRHATWLANIRSAMRWLREELNCTAISLIGLRLGAALATQAAAQESVCDLVLWAPVVKGRAFVREMKALSMTAGEPAGPSKDIEPAGFVITEQTANDLGGIDLLQTRPLCKRGLIVTRDDLPSATDTKLLDHLRGLGIATQDTAQPGYAAMMAEPHFTTVPHQAIAAIVNWMGIEKEDIVHFDPPKWLPPPNSGSERPVRICLEPHLFGILSEPVAPAASVTDLPTVVLLNAGAAYHVGPNRLHVLLARRLAANGFRCLRMDINGLGDSVTTDPARENETYPASAFRDIDLTMNYLQRDLGVRRIVLMGLCSGAYAAFQSAAQFSNQALVQSVIINPLTFFWREGMALESADSLKFQAFHDGMTSARQPGKWLKLLTGRSKLGIGGALRMLIERWKYRQQTWLKSKSGANDNVPVSCPSHPVKDDLPADLARIIKHGRPLTFIFARSDPGYGIMTFLAKRQVQEMCRNGHMRVVFIEHADHTFSRRAAREVFLQAVVADLTGRYSNSEQ